MLESRFSALIESAMRRALELAKKGPEFDLNPRVGCVILASNGRIIGEGFHLGSGADHAEVVALKQARSSSLAPHTAVVTLEPCNHTGSTPPCTQALVRAGISEVYYAIPDPTSAGGGAQALVRAGLRVYSGAGADAAYQLCRAWLMNQAQKRSWVIAKWAQSLDGRLAAPDGSSQWISSESSRAHAHHFRHLVAGVAVGANTLRADNPSLTARRPNGKPYTRQPRPIVFSSNLSEARARDNPQAVLVLRGINLLEDLKELYRAGVHSVLIEGGAKLLGAFFRANLVDEALVYIAPRLLGGGYYLDQDLGIKTLSEAKAWKTRARIGLDEDTLLRLERV